MPSKLTRLSADNYRCLLGFELRPEARNLLVGGNGTGKSSIFDLLASIQDLVISNKEVIEAFRADTVPRFSNSNHQHFELDVASDAGTYRYALTVNHELERGEAAILREEVTLDGEPLYSFVNKQVQVYRDDHTPEGLPFTFSPKRSFLASLETKPALGRLAWFRSFVEEMWILRLDPSRMVALSLSDGGPLARDGANFASWCRGLLQEEPDSLERARGPLSEVIPGFLHLRAQTAGRAKVLVAKLAYPGGEPYEIDFDLLSDGQKALVVLYVLQSSLFRRATVICLDEPDNFVSLREIQPFLVSLSDLADETGAQLFFISHSAEVIDYLGASESIFLERPDGGSTRVGAIAPGGPLRLSERIARGWHGAP